jgi:UDP-3-O-[3-hydroxymyristoyl] glucosamine N-acyltransferase
MEKQPDFWTLGELAESFRGELRGPADLPIARPAPAQSSDPQGLAFVTSEAYLRLALESAVGALLVPRQTPAISKPAIAVDDPRTTFGRFLAMCHRPLPIAEGIHPAAIVSPEAAIDPTASIGPLAVVERGARIGPDARIYPFAYIGEDCQVGPGSVVYPHAVLYQSVRLGSRCTIHAGTVLGADGFGYVWDGERRVKIPQVGGVALGDDVEIGALTGVDRATSGDTVIGKGTKLDNLIQVGHNCEIGEHTVVAALVGISGSTTIGDRVTLGGQTATSDHVTIASDTVFGGRTGITKDVLEAGTYWGLPARPIGEAMRAMTLQNKLPSLLERIRKLEARLKALEEAE